MTTSIRQSSDDTLHWNPAEICYTGFVFIYNSSSRPFKFIIPSTLLLSVNIIFFIVWEPNHLKWKWSLAEAVLECSEHSQDQDCQHLLRWMSPRIRVVLESAQSSWPAGPTRGQTAAFRLSVPQVHTVTPVQPEPSWEETTLCLTRKSRLKHRPGASLW